jgi:hypothetical protein
MTKPAAATAAAGAAVATAVTIRARALLTMSLTCFPGPASSAAVAGHRLLDVVVTGSSRR